MSLRADVLRRRVGRRIDERLTQLDWSQSEFGRRLGFTNNGPVSMVILGKRGLTLATAVRWAETLGVTVGWLLEE